MSHKILKDLGIKEGYWNNWGVFKPIESIKWFFQRKKYGCDSRECYSLDETFYQWLYEHLILFKEDSDTSIDWEQSGKVRWKKQEYTVIQLVDVLLEKLTFLFSDKTEEPLLETNEDLSPETIKTIDDIDAKEEKVRKDIREIFAIILPYLWW